MSDLDIGATEFRGMAAFYRATQLGAECLLAVADAEDRNACIEHSLRRARASLCRYRCRAAGENDALRLQFLEGFVRALKRVDFAIDAGFANTARNQLRHLAAEIDDEDAVGMGYLGHGEPLKNCRT